MIKGIFHEGSGLGNQLHRYVGTKVIALERGEKHTMIAPGLFKGKDFIKLDLESDYTGYWINGHSGEIIPYDDEGVIDGEFQHENCFIEHLDKIREWLKVEPLDMPNDICVINFRGGEYKHVSELFLPREYWDLGIKMMREINPNMRFEVHTDDVEEAMKFFPNFPIVRDIEINWCAIRYAKYLILSNSSFAILPAYLNEGVNKVIAPMYWARYNIKQWLNLDNASYSKFTYVHHDN